MTDKERVFFFDSSIVAVVVQASARVDVPTAPQFFVVRTKESHNVCTRSLHENAWICARPTTDRDLESQRHEKVNAWICARPTTDHDLASVIPGKKERKGKRKIEKEKNGPDVFFLINKS